MALWRALLPLLVYACRAAPGQSVVVVAEVGASSVLLPAKTSATLDTALWTRGSEKVLLRVPQGDDARGQSAHFTGRVQMRPDALQSGDVTLQLNNLVLSDAGNYTCVTREGSTDVDRFTVALQVKEPPPPTPPSSAVAIAVGTLGGLVALAAAVVSALTLKRTKETKESFKDALLGVVTCRKAASML